MPTINASNAATIAFECLAKNLIAKCITLDDFVAMLADNQKEKKAFKCSCPLLTILVSTLTPHTILPLPKAGRYNIFGYD